MKQQHDEVAKWSEKTIEWCSDKTKKWWNDRMTKW
jgi:hypothetical protein